MTEIKMNELDYNRGTALFFDFFFWQRIRCCH